MQLMHNDTAGYLEQDVDRATVERRFVSRDSGLQKGSSSSANEVMGDKLRENDSRESLLSVLLL